MYTKFNMAVDGGGNGETQPLSWVQKMYFEITASNYTLEQIEKAQKAGFIIERDANTGKTHVTGRIIVGSHKKDDLDVSK